MMLPRAPLSTPECWGMFVGTPGMGGGFLSVRAPSDDWSTTRDVQDIARVPQATQKCAGASRNLSTVAQSPEQDPHKKKMTS